MFKEPVLLVVVIKLCLRVARIVQTSSHADKQDRLHDYNMT